MHCTFCGVGEAFDHDQANTSLLLEHADGALLLDCGFTAAAAAFRHARGDLAQTLRAVSISHVHGDHLFGLPWLLVRMHEQGRTAPLALVGLPGLDKLVRSLLDMAYPGLSARLSFAIDHTQAAPGECIRAGGFELRFAPSEHSVPCLAVRAERNGRSIFFSGDGRPTEQTRELARTVDLCVHEAYTLGTEAVGHGSVEGCLRFARETGVGTLALVHLQRDLRRLRHAEVLARLAEDGQIEAFLPHEGERFEFGHCRNERNTNVSSTTTGADS